MDNKGKDVVLENMQKKFGSNKVVSVSEYPETEFVSTWFTWLDFIIGGWIPRWRIIELFGKSGSWKTILSMQIAKQFDLLGERILFVDTEWTFPFHLRNKLSIKNMIVATPDSWEDAVDIIRKGITEWFKYIILDSVAATVPLYELETDTAQWTVGKHARLMNKMVRTVVSLLNTYWVTLFLINQLRESIWMFVSEQPTGGQWIWYACSLRMKITKLTKKDYIFNKDTEELELIPAKIEIIKTKMRWWNENINLFLNSDWVYDKNVDMLICALSNGVIVQNGSFLKYNDVSLGQWILRAVQYLKEKKELLDIIKDQTLDILEIIKTKTWLMFSDEQKQKLYNELIIKYNKKWWKDFSLYNKKTKKEEEWNGIDKRGFESLEEIIQETWKSKATV